MEKADIQNLISQFNSYSEARKTFLSEMNMPASCRDPFSEFSEYLAAKLLNAELAESRVQKGYDLIRPDGRKVQVKYLSNPGMKWINEHHIKFDGECDDYALVIITAFKIEVVIIFRKESIREVCNLLGKRHDNQDKCLQFTRKNFNFLLENKILFTKKGIQIFTDFYR